MDTKKCGCCETEKSNNDFRVMKGKTSTQSSYLCSMCKECERSKALERYRAKRQECIDKNKEYKANNKEKINATRRCYIQEKMKDPCERIKRNMKSLICAKIRKTRHTGEYLGAPMPLITQWLEWNMTDEMNWDNYGVSWEIDHTLAINLFDVASEEEMLVCFSWMNLMPLPKIINLKKSDNLNMWRIWHQEKRLRQFIFQVPEQKDNILTFLSKYKNKVKTLCAT